MDQTPEAHPDRGKSDHVILNEIAQQRAAADRRLASQAAYLQCLGDFIASLGAPNDDSSAVTPPLDSFVDILHRSFIVTLTMVLEGELKNFSALLARYTPAAPEEGTTGSVLDRFKRRVVNRYGLDLPLDTVLWRDLRGLYQLRTTLVHDDGRLEGLPDRKRALLADFADHGNCAIVDERVVIDRATCERSLAVVARFVTNIYDVAERHFTPAG